MTKEEIEAIVHAIKFGTKVSVYDIHGDLITFNLEDLIDIRKSKDYRKKIIELVIRDYYSEDNEDDDEGNLGHYSGVIQVLGTYDSWKKKLNFNPVILNDIKEN